MPGVHLKQSQFTNSALGPFTKHKEIIKIFQRNTAFKIASSPKNDGYQRGLTSMVYKSFDNKISTTCANKFEGGSIKHKIRNKSKNKIKKNEN